MAGELAKNLIETQSVFQKLSFWDGDIICIVFPYDAKMCLSKSDTTPSMSIIAKVVIRLSILLFRSPNVLPHVLRMLAPEILVRLDDHLFLFLPDAVQVADLVIGSPIRKVAERLDLLFGVLGELRSHGWS